VNDYKFYNCFQQLHSSAANFRIGKSSINALQMNVMRRNQDATKYLAGFKKNQVSPFGIIHVSFSTCTYFAPILFIGMVIVNIGCAYEVNNKFV